MADDKDGCVLANRDLLWRISLLEIPAVVFNMVIRKYCWIKFMILSFINVRTDLGAQSLLHGTCTADIRHDTYQRIFRIALHSSQWRDRNGLHASIKKASVHSQKKKETSHLKLWCQKYDAKALNVHHDATPLMNSFSLPTWCGWIGRKRKPYRIQREMLKTQSSFPDPSPSWDLSSLFLATTKVFFSTNKVSLWRPILVY